MSSDVERTSPLATPKVESPIAAARSARQRALFGDAAQERIAGARVLVVGVGGLGCPALQSLAGAGIGTIHIVDDDFVDVTNLHRQVLFTEADVGERKVVAAAAQLADSAPHITIVQHDRAMDERFAASLVPEVDVVLDCSGTVAARKVLESAAHSAGVPVVWGSVAGWNGQVAIWWGGRKDLGGLSFADVFGQARITQPDCAEVGVLGAVTQVVGGAMALEAIRLVAGIGSAGVDRLLDFDGMYGEWRTVRVAAGASRNLDGAA